MQKYKYRQIKVVNSAVSFTDLLTYNNASDKIEELLDKKHNYGNIRPGLINNTYAIKKIITDLIDETYIDVNTGIKYKPYNLLIINNNSRYTFDVKLENLKNSTFADGRTELTYPPKTKVVVIANSDGLQVIVGNELDKLTDDELVNLLNK